MGSLDTILKLNSLESEKERSTNEAKKIQREIDSIKYNCEHIGVFLHKKDQNNSNCKCLICDKILDFSETINCAVNDLYIDAKDYLSYQNITPQEKFAIIKKNYIKFCQDYPDIENSIYCSVMNTEIKRELENMIDSKYYKKLYRKD